MNWNVIIPLILFTIIIFAIGFWSSRKLSSSNSFLSDYFLGGRELGGLVLAMTMVATYGSASSFLGGPGAAYSIGLGWVLLSMTQVATGYFVLLILGKKFAIVTRRFKAITLIDFLKERYKSHTVVILSAFSIIIFLFSAMAAQWVGGAYLIQLLTGLSYTSALFIFTLTVIIYVVIGGFRAVALTDTLQGIVMFFGTLILLIAVIIVGGGLDNIFADLVSDNFFSIYVVVGVFRVFALTDTLQGIVMFFGTLILLIAVIIAGGGLDNIFADLVSENPNLITPYGQDGQLTALYVSSFWILVGVGVVALPQVAIRAMSYRDSKSMHKALVIGTIVVGFIMLNMRLIGVFARPILPGIEFADQVIPLIALDVLPGWLAGIVLAAPLAAMMSTLDSLLLLVSSSVVKDIYLNYIKPEATMNHVKKVSVSVTAVIGIVAFLMAS